MPRAPTKKQRIALATRIRLGEARLVAGTWPPVADTIRTEPGPHPARWRVFVLDTYVGALSRRPRDGYAWHSKGRPYLNPGGSISISFLACVLAYLERD